MENKVIELTSNTKFSRKIAKNSILYDTYDKINNEGHLDNDGSDNMSNEIDLLKQQIIQLEQQFNEKLESRDKLVDAKFETVLSKMETFQATVLGEIKSSNNEVKGEINTLKSDMNTMKSDIKNEIRDEIAQSKKDTKVIVWTATGVIATIATLIATILIPIFTK